MWAWQGEGLRLVFEAHSPATEDLGPGVGSEALETNVSWVMK